MISSRDTAQREHLRFVDAVDKHIAPVLRKYGFTCAIAGPYEVEFRSPAVTLRLTHDRLSYEIEARFAQAADPSRTYGLSDLLRLSLGPIRQEQGVFQASSPQGVDKCLRDIGVILTEHGTSILSGDDDAFHQMGQLARVHDEIHTKEIVQEPVRHAAEEAWRVHGYATVVELYGSIEDSLTLVEKKRLAYARQHMLPI